MIAAIAVYCYCGLSTAIVAATFPHLVQYAKAGSIQQH
jgi:hypothetical protein